VAAASADYESKQQQDGKKDVFHAAFSFGYVVGDAHGPMLVPPKRPDPRRFPTTIGSL
jgi:hypothetical protein